MRDKGAIPLFREMNERGARARHRRDGLGLVTSETIALAEIEIQRSEERVGTSIGTSLGVRDGERVPPKRVFRRILATGRRQSRGRPKNKTYPSTSWSANPRKPSSSFLRG